MTSNATTETAVLIVGAGPVGLTLANELRRRDVAVRIVDKAPGIREISKALIWHVRTQEALDKVGVIERGKAEARMLTQVSVHAYGKHIGNWHLDGVDGPHPCPLIIGQNRTQHLLLDLLHSRGTQVEWNTEAVAMQIDVDGVSTTLRRLELPSEEAHDAIVRSQYVVGCEGSNSLVRKTLGLTFEGEKYAGEQFIQADCNISWTLPAGRSYLFLTDDGYLMVIEMPGGMVRIFISLPDNPPDAGSEEQTPSGPNLGAAEDMSHEPTLEEIHDNFVRLTGIEAALSDPVWLARYRTSHRYANTFGEGRAFVAGDAGHVHVPIGGQGMNTGIQDAFNLGWKLAGVVQGRYDPDLLKTYTAERHPVAAGLITGTDRAYKGILHPGELQQRAARMFGPFLIKNPTVQNLVRSTLEELDISYPNSPLNGPAGRLSPKPGERVPNAPVVRLTNRRTITLNELTRHPGWTLLLFSGTSQEAVDSRLIALGHRIQADYDGIIQTHLVVSATALPRDCFYEGSVLIDAEHDLHDKYHVTDASFTLLRPDTYVGFRGSIDEDSRFLKYLGSIFVS